jgi:mannose-1-phosphate guanylyltransferase
MAAMYVVIMAGGGGTRLWPLSRPDRPKPFLPLLGDETLLQATVRRLLGPELGIAPGDVTVVTDRRYATLVRAQLEGVEVLAEPTGRNTAAAVALAALAIDRPEDEVMVVLPADHRIDPAREGMFRGVLAAAARALAGDSPFGVDGPLVTLGVQPTHPSTEYGYLVPQADAGADIAGLRAYPLKAFEEKPIVSRARDLLQGGGVAWNAGMFLWRRGTILAALERYTTLPGVIGPAAGSPAALAAAYDRIQPISIDHAVMEGAARDRRVVMAALDVGWSDLGGWGALLEALGRPGVDGRVVQPGQAVDGHEGDLVVLREGERLAVRTAAPGTMTHDRPVALLRGAADAEPVVQLLLDRCAASEARP